MKLTDLSIIFVVIIMPVIILVYINTSYVIKAEKEEMYYKTVIDAATKDAVNKMKQIENTNLAIDYGYSGFVDNKISINAEIAIDTFYDSLFNNFGIAGDDELEFSMKGYIPVIAVFDYDGIYIHSAEKDFNSKISYVTKPKIYYSHVFCIDKNASGSYHVVDGNEVNSVLPDSGYEFNVVYTMDDYIYVYVMNINNKTCEKYGLYMNDQVQLSKIMNYCYTTIASDELSRLVGDLKDAIKSKREEVIAEKATDAVTTAINKHNVYAKQLNINYEFSFAVESETDWNEKINSIGMLAVVQGISLGNRYLDYNAYTASSLIQSTKYLLSNRITNKVDDNTYMNMKLYHNIENCPILKEYIYRWRNEYWEMTPKFFYDKEEATANGYSPCPVCRP